MSMIKRSIPEQQSTLLTTVVFANLSFGHVHVEIYRSTREPSLYEAVLCTDEGPLRSGIRMLASGIGASELRLALVEELTKPTTDIEAELGTLWAPGREFVESIREELRALAVSLYT